jgi:hypothetical protein
MYNPTTPGYNTQNQTRFTPNYEPTVSDNPYASSPYDLQKAPTPPKPPPPRQGNKGILVALISVSCLTVLLFGGLLLTMIHFSSNPGPAQATPTLAFTSTPAPKQDYTATDIVNDFIAHHLVVDSLQYGRTIYDFTSGTYVTSSANLQGSAIDLQSSATFYGPSPCTGPCSANSGIGVWVYKNVDDAKSTYNDVQQDISNCMTNPPDVGFPDCPDGVLLRGRCVLLGYKPLGSYADIVDTDCI